MSTHNIGFNEAILMSTHNIGFYEDLTKNTIQLSSNIIKYAPFLFFCFFAGIVVTRQLINIIEKQQLKCLDLGDIECMSHDHSLKFIFICDSMTAKIHTG